MIKCPPQPQEALNDVAVLLLFFTRSETFQKVFDEVRKARPSKLFLFQDGPRNENDLAGIEACRKIAADENIDWKCEVHRNYQEQNLGCMTAGFISHRWAFSLADKCIVIEDDVVPSQSFIPFCKEMLDRYEHDERITMVSGFNMDEQTKDCPYDYFFTSAFSIWGWASWRRVVEKWDGSLSILDDKYYLDQLQNLIKVRGYKSDFIKTCRLHRDSGYPQFESVFWSHMMLNNGLAIMPSQNMISNIGATEDSAHYSALKTLPKAIRRIFLMQRYELNFPLRHPKYVVDNVAYQQRMNLYNAWNHPWIKVGRSFEELYLNLRYGNFSRIAESFVERIRKWLGISRKV